MASNASKDLTITLRVSLPHREFPLLFYIRAEDLTWKNLLITLFGHNDFEEDKQPHIQYIRNGRRCNLSDDRRVMNDFIRFALLTPSRETGITLLIRKYDDYCNMKKSTTTTTPPLVKNAGWPSKNGIHEYCETDLKLNDIVKIFDSKLTDEHIRNGVLSDLNSNLPYNKLERDPHFKHWVINNSYREEGNLSVRRLDGEEFTKVIKSGVHVVVTRENGEYLLLKFNKESIPSMYEMRLNWTMPDRHTLKCDDLKIPVSIEKEMNFVFPQDAEFVKNFESNINVKQSSSAKASNQADSATTSSPPETQQTPWWPSETSQTLPPSRNAHLWGVSGEMKSCSRVENDKQKPSSSKKKSSTKSPYVWPSYAGWIPNAPNFGFRWDYQRQCWQTVDNSSQKNFDPWGAQVTSNGSTQTVQTPAKRSPPVVFKPTSDWDKWEKINENAGVQQTAENKQSLVDDGAANNSTMPPPKWLKDELDKFKEQINEEMKKTMKSIVDTIQQTKVNSPSTSGHGKYSRKTLPAEFVTGLETLTINEKKHRSAEGSRKRKLAVPAPGKALEICSELSIVSMSGFKVRMPRNASMTLKLTLVKYGKYRTSREEPEPRVTSASDGIECCVTTAGVENMHSWYDVRIKTKDKSGKFRFVFNVMHNGKPVGRAVHFVVRVKRTYTLPVVPDLIDLNSEPSQYGEAVEGAVADVTSGSRAFEDEGIGGNQEDFYSPTSDSEDSMDADEGNFAQTKTDVPKDEGIDTCYPVAKKDDLSWEVFSDSDTDSSISFLMDESEARDKEMDTEVVNLPSCFITNASSNEETLSVRVVRKRDHTRAIKKGKTSDASTSSDLELPSTKANETTTDSDPTPAALKEQAERAYNRSMYPNLQGLKEFVNPLPEKPTEQAKPSTSETKAEPCPVNILHEKVFEAVGTMWNKVYQTKKTFSETLNETDTLHKQVKDTVTCVAAKAVQEAKAAVTAAQAAAAAATTAANSVPTQTQGSAPNVFNVETLESAARSVAAAASAAQAAVAAATTAAYTQPSQTATASTMTTPQPSTSAKPATASSPQHSQPESEIDGACASSTSTTPNDSEKDSKKETTRMHNIYVNLSEETLQQLAVLNDMGFTDDHYSIYLLNQFSNDLNKVVENLIHYSSL